jgi:hypothetical protein
MTGTIAGPGGWNLLHTGLQAAGFLCLTAASALGTRALLRGPGSPGAAGLEAGNLRWTRAGFLGLSGALVAGALGNWRIRGELGPGSPVDQWVLAAWLIFFVVLHAHRVKGFRPGTAILAGLAGWALALGGWLAAWAK